MVAPFDPAKFRAMFPAFSDDTVWTDELLTTYYEMASEFISKDECPCRILRGKSLELALYLMTAHIAMLLNPEPDAAGGGGGGATAGGIVTSASIGAVSVSIAAPNSKNSWDYWLNQSPYGQQLLALLSMKGVGGIYVPGLPERLGFRKVGGTFR